MQCSAASIYPLGTAAGFLLQQLARAPPALGLVDKEQVWLSEEVQQANNFKIQGKFWSSSCAPEQYREYVPYITKAVKPGAGFGSFPGGAIFTGRVCRRVCVLYIKRLPGGNSGVQWLLALIPSPRPSVCVSFAPGGPGKDCRSTLHCHNAVALSHLTYQSLYGNKCHQAPDMCCLLAFGAA